MLLYGLAAFFEGLRLWGLQNQGSEGSQVPGSPGSAAFKTKP